MWNCRKYTSTVVEQYHPTRPRVIYFYSNYVQVEQLDAVEADGGSYEVRCCELRDVGFFK
jgi:hypothetical protein